MAAKIHIPISGQNRTWNCIKCKKTQLFTALDPRPTDWIRGDLMYVSHKHCHSYLITTRL